ncbi:DUF397 domain-containing protein [Virgisporangium aurantiacum]|uniref:DUF397 domain-containing protein n=1 Tax=Virgisporangium aurantiacum TaxID=175570 RepID=UPI00194E6955|nr:DUF397 domain-containing protein [Virgisporangium aurantiacum]
MNREAFSNEWRVSSRCASGTCVAASYVSSGVVLVRDTKLAADGPILRFSTASWSAFTAGLRHGDFDPRRH